MKIKSFECPNSIRNYEKKNWNVRRFGDKLFVPSAQQTSVLYCRLSDLLTMGSFLMSIKMDKRRDWLVDSKLSERPLAVSRWIWGGEINDFDIIFPVGLVVF